MALWGTADSLYSVGTVSVDYATKTITGTATSFTAFGISAGDVITIGAGGTYGSAVISGITSDLVISIATTQYLSGEVISGVAYTISEKPIFTLEDSVYNTASYSDNKVYGIDVNETGLLAPGASDLSTKYGGFHAGWVGIHTYIDTDGNFRVKTETLVAMSSVSGGKFATYGAAGDANDDTVLADAAITITSQPASVGVGTTATATFSVTATVVPSYAPLSYQWYEEGSVLAGETGTSVSIANTDASKDGYEYQVVITSGDVTATSGIATMTVS